MRNEEVLMPIINKFYNKINNKEFVIDKTGCKIVELICENIALDPDPILNFNIKKTNEDYCKHELDWYNSQDLNVKEIARCAKLWNSVCDKQGNVNSNYGWCIYSDANYNQYINCRNELIQNKETRRAVMIYNRPSMWKDFNNDGMNDFICTFDTQCFIRDNKLCYIVNMRSCDFIFGFFNDFFWHCNVYNKLYQELIQFGYKDLQIGKIIWIANSLHVYERHFEMIKKIVEASENG